MKSNWLSQTQEALRAKAINLSGPYIPPEKEAQAIRNSTASCLPLIADLLENKDNIKAARLENAFLNGLEKGVLRTVKGIRRGIKAGFTDKVDTADTENLEVIAGEYRSAIDFVLSLSHLNTGTFSKAAVITPFWNGEALGKTLSLPGIRKYLEEKGVKMSEEEVGEVFTKGVRMYFAVNNIKDPLEAVGRAAGHITKTLSLPGIQKYLEEKGIKMSEEEVGEVFTKGVRMYFAVNNIKDPLEAVGRAAGHITRTLSLPGIRKYLEEKGLKMSEEEVREVFTKGVRMYFAVHNIKDPLEACLRYAKGELAYAGRVFM